MWFFDTLPVPTDAPFINGVTLDFDISTFFMWPLKFIIEMFNMRVNFGGFYVSVGNVTVGYLLFRIVWASLMWMAGNNMKAFMLHDD